MVTYSKHADGVAKLLVLAQLQRRAHGCWAVHQAANAAQDLPRRDDVLRLAWLQQHERRRRHHRHAADSMLPVLLGAHATLQQRRFSLFASPGCRRSQR